MRSTLQLLYPEKQQMGGHSLGEERSSRRTNAGSKVSAA